MKRATAAFSIVILALGAGGCGVVGEVLAIGFWVALIVVVLIVVAIWGLSRTLGAGGRRPPPPRPPAG